MNRMLVFCIADRLEYLLPMLDSWTRVRGLDRWTLVARLEPSPVLPQARLLVGLWSLAVGVPVTVVENPTRYGVSHHPWVAFEEAFADETTDFVVLVEDDHLVSTDVLEYLEWASVKYAHSLNVANVAAANAHNVPAHLQVHTRGPYHSLVNVEESSGRPPLGVWRRSWIMHLRDSWDHDYSTTVNPNQAGYDWNFDLRVYPSNHLLCVFPLASRALNIGVNGVHGNSANFVQHPYFEADRSPTTYVEV